MIFKRSRKYLLLPVVIAVITTCFACSGKSDSGVQAENTPQDFSETRLGLRPASAETVAVNPPDFAWGPLEGEESYHIEISRNPEFNDIEYRGKSTPYCIYRPKETLEPGLWHWRVAAEKKIRTSAVYSFRVPKDATHFPAPDFETMLERIPSQHPRLLLRPQDLPAVREASRGELADQWAYLTSCAEEALVMELYTPTPENEPRGSAEKIAHWRANYSIARNTVYAGENLAFCYLISNEQKYLDGARRVLNHILSWDPEGPTSMFNNDECGMPVLQYLPRMYDWLYDALTPREREAVVENLRIRGRDARKDLGNVHVRGYDSHAHRMYHQLAEAGIAMYTELPEAREWIMHALNIYHCWYPIWGDPDGGWSAGLGYYSGYVVLLCNWLEAARSALGLDPNAHPFVSKAGDFAMYLGPGGAFTQSSGDGAEVVSSSGMRPLLSVLGQTLRQGNLVFMAGRIAPFEGEGWIDVRPGEKRPPGWFSLTPGTARPLTFISKAVHGEVAPEAPTDAATAKLFEGIGYAVMNSNMVDGQENVQVQFRSSLLGTFSHMHSDQNGFFISAFGERLAIHAGYRPWYGSEFCKQYYWDSKAQNTVLVNGEGQVNRSLEAVGRITRHSFSEHIDLIEGEAAEAYGGRVDRFTRRIVFVKPDIVLVIDHLEAPEPSRFSWLFHAQGEIRPDGGAGWTVAQGDAWLRGTFLQDEPLELEITDKYPIEPELPSRLGTQWHLSAQSAELKQLRIVTLMQIGRDSIRPVLESELDGEVIRIHGDGREIVVDESGGQVRVRVDTGGEVITARM